MAKFASRVGLSKLNAACLHESAKDVEALLDDSAKIAGQGLTEIDGNGWNAIHYACQNKREGAAILKLLVSRGFSLKLLTNNGSSPLHEACRNGNNDAVQLILKQLKDVGDTDLISALEMKDKEGNTALHLVCRGGHVSVVNTLMTICGFAENNGMRKQCVCTNNTGATPMGLAIGGEHLDTARLLFDFLPSGNPAVTLKDFHNFCPHSQLVKSLRPIECEPMNIFFLGDSGSGKSTLIKTLQAHYQGTLSALYTLLPHVSHVTDMHKVGIIPNAIKYPQRHDHQCPIIFHDVTGHRNYAHEAIFKCAENPLESLYLITVDVRATEEVIKSKILYWLHFLSYALSQYLASKRSPSSSVAKLYVMVIGTFNDQMPPLSRPQAMLSNLCRRICDSDENRELLSQFEWKDPYALNARKGWRKMFQLRSVLKEHCQKIHPQDHEHPLPGAQRYMLAAVVSNCMDERSTSVMSFEDVIQHVKSSDNILNKLLKRMGDVVDEIALMDLCQHLKQFSQFRIYENFIILDLHQLLSNINTTINGLSHVHGIVSHSDLHKVFQKFKFPSGFIIKFMESFQICKALCLSQPEQSHSRTSTRLSESMVSEKIYVNATGRRKRSSTDYKRYSEFVESFQIYKALYPSQSDQPHSRTSTRLSESTVSEKIYANATGRKKRSSTEQPPSAGSISSVGDHKDGAAFIPVLRPYQLFSQGPYCFFPTLIPAQPPDKWKADYKKYTYGFAWSLRPSEGQYYPPRYVTDLLFHLLHDFAPYKTEYAHQHEKECDLWNCGIMWHDSKGIRACVAVHDNQTVTLSMQCVQDAELECMKLRNLVMLKIKNLWDDLEMNSSFSEVFIPDDKSTTFPIYIPANAPAWYNKREIGETMIAKSPSLYCTKRKHHLILRDMLFFEPLSILPPPLLQQLLDEKLQDEKMSEKFILGLATEIGDKWLMLAKYFKFPSSFIDDVTRAQQVENLAPYWAAHVLIQHLRLREEAMQTYRELKESLMKISIFSEDELFKFANLNNEEVDTSLEDTYAII